MKINQLTLTEARARLALQGLGFTCGPFNVTIRSNLPQLAIVFKRMYADFEVVEEDAYVDFEVQIAAPNALRRFFRPQVTFSCDGRMPFKPLPLSQAFPMLEWGLNWVISSHAHRFLVIHAAVVEKDGRALILAADPGSGKSTLCAALVQHGWRLLSDELALVDLSSGLAQPIARPISLKNASIDVVRGLRGEVEISPVCHDTAKGSIAHMKPPAGSVAALNLAVMPAAVVFPKYVPNAPLSSERVGRAHAFLEIARHAFNYSVLTSDGFDAISRLVDQTQVFRVSYSSFEQVIPEIERLWRETP